MLFLGVALYGAVVAVPAEPPADVSALEKSVLDYRRALHSGHMEFRQNTFLNGASTPARERSTAVWFEGNQVRNDILSRYPKDATQHKEINCRNCEYKGYYVEYNSYSKDVLPTVHLEPLAGEENPDRSAALDPRLLGLVVDTSAALGLSRSRLDSYVGAPNREGVTMEQGSWKEVECRVIHFRFPQWNQGVRVWVVPAWGPSVVRIETSGKIEREGPTKGLDYQDSVESDYKPVGAAPVWFPRTCVYERRIGGKVYEREVADVEVRSLNEPLPPDVFKLAGMDIPPKTAVVGYRKEGLSYWDGKTIVPQDPPLTLPVVPSVGFGSISDNWPYIVSAVVFALTGAGAILLYLRQRHPKPGTTK